MQQFDYDVALSFAGEDRAIAEKIAEHLKRSNVLVFYDKYEQATLFGKDLFEHLHEVYSKRARYCAMLVSRNYAQRLWTNHERRAAQERALAEVRNEYILPIRLDDTDIPGLSRNIGYLNIADGIESICRILVEKLRAPVAARARGVESVHDLIRAALLLKAEADQLMLDAFEANRPVIEKAKAAAKGGTFELDLTTITQGFDDQAYRLKMRDAYFQLARANELDPTNTEALLQRAIILTSIGAGDSGEARTILHRIRVLLDTPRDSTETFRLARATLLSATASKPVHPGMLARARSLFNDLGRQDWVETCDTYSRR